MKRKYILCYIHQKSNSQEQCLSLYGSNTQLNSLIMHQTTMPLSLVLGYINYRMEDNNGCTIREGFRRRVHTILKCCSNPLALLPHLFFAKLNLTPCV